MKITVVGDTILDVYCTILPSRSKAGLAPPVFLEKNSSTFLGGAANTANLMAQLGTETTLISAVGDDWSGRKLKELCTQSNFASEFLLPNDYPTTTKRRFVLDGSVRLRLDREQTLNLSRRQELNLFRKIRAKIVSSDALVIQDYDKGLLKRKTVGEILQLAKRFGVPVFVDPKKANYWEYNDVLLFKPSIKDMSDTFNQSLRVDDGTLEAACRETSNRLCCKHLIVTLGSQGIACFCNGNLTLVPAPKLDLVDTVGAGGTVFACLAKALIAGAPINASIDWAIENASTTCKHLGPGLPSHTVGPIQF